MLAPVESRASNSDDANRDGNSNHSSPNLKATAESPYKKPEEMPSAHSACALSVSSSRYMPKVLMAMSLMVMLVSVWAYSMF